MDKASDWIGSYLTTMSTVVETITQALPTLSLRPGAGTEDKTSSTSEGQQPEQKPEDYEYAHLLPVWVPDHYPPLEPFEHVDPGYRALQHPNPRSFLHNATTIVDLTPHLGTEVTGVSLAQLDSDGRDQLALAVCRTS
jgi:sulfonate dioxygenase